MMFAEILDQSVAMLQRCGRIAYGALKRQFDLDDYGHLSKAGHFVVDPGGRLPRIYGDLPCCWHWTSVAVGLYR